MLPPIGTEIILDSKVIRVDGHPKNASGASNVRWTGPNDSIGVCTQGYWEHKECLAKEQAKKKQSHGGRAGSPKKSHKFL